MCKIKMMQLFWSRYIVICRPLATAICALSLFGCWSAKSAIDSGAIEARSLSVTSEGRFLSIEELASSSEARFEQTGDLQGVAEQQEIVAEAISGSDEQRDIQGLADGIRTNLHGVDDKIPWWANMTTTIAIVVGIVVVFLFLWRSGILGFIRKAIWGLGIFIPQRKIQEAQLDLKVMDASSPTTIRESVASKRASDPAYEAAYKKVKGRT
jgi:hypothetical protein